VPFADKRVGVQVKLRSLTTRVIPQRFWDGFPSKRGYNKCPHLYLHLCFFPPEVEKTRKRRIRPEVYRRRTTTFRLLRLMSPLVARPPDIILVCWLSPFITQTIHYSAIGHSVSFAVSESTKQRNRLHCHNCSIMYILSAE